jgi:hypothetical protein
VLLAWGPFGCGGGNDYYDLAGIEGGGDNVELEFIYTCGSVDVSWDGRFIDKLRPYAELVIHHDDLGNDCEEDPRKVPFDAGPMKRAFRADHPWPTPLGLRVGPYEEEQGAKCLRNLFQDAPFRAKSCK